MAFATDFQLLVLWLYWFLIGIIPPNESWSFINFMKDSELLSPRMRWVGFLWLLLQILNYYHLIWRGLDFYDFHYKFSIIVTPPKTG